MPLLRKVSNMFIRDRIEVRIYHFTICPVCVALLYFGRFSKDPRNSPFIVNNIATV
jgi:hypothetical protein